MAAQALTYALLANPKLIETGYRAARGTAITVGKLMLFGAIGYGTYKALSKTLDSAQAKNDVRKDIRSLNDTAYKAAMYFTSYFTASTLDKQKIKTLVKEVYSHGDLPATIEYYFRMNFGKKLKGDCYAGFMFCTTYDESGNLIEHLKIALGDEFEDIIPYLGSYVGL